MHICAYILPINVSFLQKNGGGRGRRHFYARFMQLYIPLLHLPCSPRGACGARVSCSACRPSGTCDPCSARRTRRAGIPCRAGNSRCAGCSRSACGARNGVCIYYFIYKYCFARMAARAAIVVKAHNFTLAPHGDMPAQQCFTAIICPRRPAACRRNKPRFTQITMPPSLFAPRVNIYADGDRQGNHQHADHGDYCISVCRHALGV